AEGGLVDVRTRRGDTAEALDTLRQTLEIASANDLRLAQAAMCSTLMTVHALVGERGAVEEVYRAGVELCREQGDDHVIAELHATAAELRALRGDADSAQDALRAAEALAGSSPGPVPAIRTAIARGTVAEAQGDREGAVRAYREARATARRRPRSSRCPSTTTPRRREAPCVPSRRSATVTSCCCVPRWRTRCGNDSATSSSIPTTCGSSRRSCSPRRPRPRTRSRRRWRKASKPSCSAHSSSEQAGLASATAAGAPAKPRSSSRCCCSIGSAPSP